jgi:TolB-like protein/Flp pilus assembly protein TadD
MFAVLPFENLTGDPSQEYFSDGLTEEMIGQLGRTDPQRLGVIARTSVMHYKNSQEPLSQIGSELGVQYLLEGSVRRDSNRVRISAKLIQARDQTPLWSRDYDRDEKSLLALQSEIAREIADEIQLTLGHATKSATVPTAAQDQLSPTVYESHDLYLQGLYSWNKRTLDGFRRSADLFQQAVAKDPNNALAYAGLANCYALISNYNLGRPGDSMEKARAAALRALQIDEKLPQAHTALALIVESYDWDWQAAEREYQRAIQLDPSYATAHQWYAEFLTFQGRFDQAFAESARARELDPLSLIIAADHAAILYFSRQYERSIEEFRSVLAMEPGYPRAGLVVFAYAEGGHFADALAEIEKRRGKWSIAWVFSSEAYVYGREGEIDKARVPLRRLEHLEINAERISEISTTIAPAYAAAGENQQALAWLERLAENHNGVLATIKVDPALDPLRAEPRFQELLRKTRLVP